MSSPPGLSVIIVCWNAASVLGECLQSLIDHPPKRRFEILVLDNGSADSSLEIARGFGDRIELVELGENRGFAAACNEGYRRGNGDYLLFLNSDIRALPSSLENLCRFIDDNSRAAAAGGKLVGSDGVPQRGFNLRRFPSPLSTAFEILLVDKVLPRNPVSRKQRMLDFSYSETVQVDQPAGACLLVRRSAFEAVGLFDERFYPAWFEDVDLCLRLARAGFKIFFVPEASFHHQGGASLETLSYDEFLSFYYRNLLRFFDKHYPPSTTALPKALIPLGMAKRMMLGLLVAPRPGVERRDALAAYWRVMREAF